MFHRLVLEQGLPAVIFNISDIKDKDIPLLPLRDVVIFPSVVTPLFV